MHFCFSYSVLYFHDTSPIWCYQSTQILEADTAKDNAFAQLLRFKHHSNITSRCHISVRLAADVTFLGGWQQMSHFSMVGSHPIPCAQKPLALPDCENFSHSVWPNGWWRTLWPARSHCLHQFFSTGAFLIFRRVMWGFADDLLVHKVKGMARRRGV